VLQLTQFPKGLVHMCKGEEEKAVTFLRMAIDLALFSVCDSSCWKLLWEIQWQSFSSSSNSFSFLPLNFLPPKLMQG